MKKLVLVLTILSILVLTSCNLQSEGRILNKLDKHLNKYTGYSTDLEMKISMDDQINTYRMRERNALNNNYTLEILEPRESRGITIEFKDNKVYINNANIRQSITLNSVKRFDESLLIGKFLREPNKILNINEKEGSNSSYYVFRNKISNRNKYSREQKIYLNKKDFVPQKLEILDSNGDVRVTIDYINFKYTND